jgi:hypothetical protein
VFQSHEVNNWTISKELRPVFSEHLFFWFIYEGLLDST